MESFQSHLYTFWDIAVLVILLFIVLKINHISVEDGLQSVIGTMGPYPACTSVTFSVEMWLK